MTMSYEIITDSCCDFTAKLYNEQKVGCASLTVSYNGETHKNFSDESAVKAFYDLSREGVLATTAAAGPADWADLMEPILKRGEDVLALCFSSGLSTTYQSAVIAAKDLREEYPGRTIEVVDTLSAALGQGLLVYLACQKRDEGMSLADLTAWVEENKFHLCHWFTVDDLAHLKRGGRVSATTALVGTMLNIKPVLHVDNDGHLINTAKVRGRKASLEYMAKKLKETATDTSTVFIGHGDCREDAQMLAAMLKEQSGVENVYIGYVGPVIGAHTGPGVVALFFLGTQR